MGMAGLIFESHPLNFENLHNFSVAVLALPYLSGPHCTKVKTRRKNEKNWSSLEKTTIMSVLKIFKSLK